MINPTQFQNLLSLFQHSLTKEQQIALFLRLRPFGTSANKAMERYMAEPPSPFFDWSHLMKLLRGEIVKDLGLPLPEQVWGFIVQKLTKTPPTTPITWGPVMGQVIEALGGHQALRNSTNDVADRARAQAAFEKILNTYITELIVEKWQPE